jgi:hypothetical protein
MKIYITNIFPSSIKDKLTNIQNLLVNSHGTNKHELISTEFGTHFIEEDKQKNTSIYRIEPNFNQRLQLVKGYTNGLGTASVSGTKHNKPNDLLLDYTKYTHCPVVSQMPTDYILIKMIVFEYKTNPKSKLKLVVEYLKEPMVGNYFSTNKHIGENMVPINFYFDYNYNYDSKHETNYEIDLMDPFFQEEINMFLSHLN